MSLSQEDLYNPEVPLKIFDDSEPLVRLAILYNPFDTSAIEFHEMELREEATLADYLIDLPEETNWAVAVNAVPANKETWGDIKIGAGDTISLVVVPTGGTGGKDILRMVALVAVVAVALWMPGAIGLAAGSFAAGATTAGVMAVGSLLVFALLPPEVARNNGTESSNTYGIDGQKNTSKEGISVPVIYGEYRVGGNFSDNYTENDGEDQILYLRNVLCDGEIEGVYDPEINDQPVSHYDNVQWRSSLGTDTQPVDEWFNEGTVQENKSVKIDQAGVVHLTTTSVDKVRFDITFAKGLSEITNKGKYKPLSVDFEFFYSVPGANNWQPLPMESWHYGGAGSMATGGYSRPYPWRGSPEEKATLNKNVDILKITVGSNAYMGGTRRYQIRYRIVGSPTWTTRPEVTVPQGEVIRNYRGGQPQYQSFERVETINVPNGNYEVEVLSSNDTVGLKRLDGYSNTENSVRVTDNRSGAIRKSFTSQSLPYGTYDVKIRRTSVEQNDDKNFLDEVWLTDVAEINTSKVALRNTATAQMRIKLTDQLNGIPTVTYRVKGAILQEYDIEGNPTVRRWSANPAWAVIDMHCGDKRGAGTPLSSIDFPAFVAWAEYCDANNITINGVFDTVSSLWDAVIKVMRVGHAAPIPAGTKMSVAIEDSTPPSMVFGSSAIIKDSFGIDYLAIEDRANEIEGTYYDKTNGNAAKTLRVVDPIAESLGLPQRVATIDMFGVDNYDQAHAEIWRQIYQNRYLRRHINFDAPLESIALTVGDVALIQHDMTEWSVSGRLESTSTTTQLDLDRSVTMEAGKNYSVLVHYPAIKRYEANVTSVVGQTIYVDGSLPGTNSVSRFVQGSKDLRIIKASWGSPLSAILVEGDLTGITNSLCELWATDALEEKAIVTVAGDTTSLTMPSPLPDAPIAGSQWLFGESAVVKKPYRLLEINGSGVEKRSLKWSEYNENMYAAPESVIPAGDDFIDFSVKHVTGISVKLDPYGKGETKTARARLKWLPTNVENYGGVDIYMSINDGEFSPVGSVQSVTEYYTTVEREDSILFKIVAFNKKGIRASVNTAPLVYADIDVWDYDLEPPTALTATPVSWEVRGETTLTWTAPVDETVTEYRVEYRNVTLGSETDWMTVSVTETTEQILKDLKEGSYEVQVRAEHGRSISEWVMIPIVATAPVMATPLTGLRLFGGTPDIASDTFTGRDASFSWDDFSGEAPLGRDPYFLDYEVRILTPADVVIRVEYTQDPHYDYTYEKNVADHIQTAGMIARRDFKFEVRARGRQGQVTPAATMSVSNPAPGVPAGVSLDPSINSVFVAFNKPDDSDFQGCEIYVGSTSGFTPDASNLAYKGADNSVSIPLVAGQTSYIIIQPVDAFGADPASRSPAYPVNPVSIDVSNKNFVLDLQFSTDEATNTISWTAGSATVEDGTNTVTQAIAAGNHIWSSGISYIYYREGDTTLTVTSDISVAMAQDRRVAAIYKGGSDAAVSLGDVLIDGDKILAGTVGAGQLVTGTAVITGAAQIADAIITDAKITGAIQSNDWNDTTKQGWKLDKGGSFEGNAVSIYNENGKLIFGTGDYSRNWSDLSVYTQDVIYRNVLDPSQWTVGTSGDQGIFGANGDTSQSSIISDTGPYGDIEPIWKGTSNGGNPNGGYLTQAIGSADGYDNSKTYRYSVWIKQNHAADGSKYLGCWGVVQTLAGVDDNNPYFWVGNLPQNNKWYLVVGVLHGHGYTGGDTGVAGVYDPVTGTKVMDGTEFKAKPETVTQRARTFLYYDLTGTVEILIARPRIEAMDGSEPSIYRLLNNVTDLSTYISGLHADKIQAGTITADKLQSNIITTSHIATQGIAINGIENFALIEIASAFSNAQFDTAIYGSNNPISYTAGTAPFRGLSGGVLLMSKAVVVPAGEVWDISLLACCGAKISGGDEVGLFGVYYTKSGGGYKTIIDLTQGALEGTSNHNFFVPYAFAATDVLTAGTYTFYFKYGRSTSSDTAYFSNRFVQIIGTKRNA